MTMTLTMTMTTMMMFIDDDEEEEEEENTKSANSWDKDPEVHKHKAMISSMELMLKTVQQRDDEAAVTTKNPVNTELERAKHKVTAAKPLDVQMKIQEDVVVRQQKKVNKARSEVASAQARLVSITG